MNEFNKAIKQDGFDVIQRLKLDITERKRLKMSTYDIEQRICRIQIYLKKL